MGLIARTVAGTVGGLLATGGMTLVMTAGQKQGLMGKMPPRKIIEAVIGRVRGRRPSRAGARALAAAAHLAFGALAGGGYGALARRRRPLGPAVGRGAVYGSLIWLVSYAGWVPALRIMPPPSRDLPGRQATMLLAHLLYGGLLGAMVQRG